MGKLGGEELNVSSDIDLIFVYPEDGADRRRAPFSNHEFFSRLGRRLITMISELTADGYVFRVDMRLRPYGESGPLVSSFAALEEYLVSQGREWERYAWIKARVVALHPLPSGHTRLGSPQVAGYPASGERNEGGEQRTRRALLNPSCEGANESLRELYVNELQLVQPFVFRKYLDFGAFESMRKLHAQIRQEVQRRDLFNNIKLGPGGIREIEFIAQVFQLIRGGRMPGCVYRRPARVLQVLAANGQLARSKSSTDLDAKPICSCATWNTACNISMTSRPRTLPENARRPRTASRKRWAMRIMPRCCNRLDRHRALRQPQFEQHLRRAEARRRSMRSCGTRACSEQELARPVTDLGFRTLHSRARNCCCRCATASATGNCPNRAGNA